LHVLFAGARGGGGFNGRGNTRRVWLNQHVRLSHKNTIYHRRN